MDLELAERKRIEPASKQASNQSAKQVESTDSNTLHWLCCGEASCLTLRRKKSPKPSIVQWHLTETLFD